MSFNAIPSNLAFQGLKNSSLNTASVIADSVNTDTLATPALSTKVVTGFAPVGFVGSTAILAFNKEPGQVAATAGSNSQALTLPAGAMIKEALLTNNDVPLTGVTTVDVGLSSTFPLTISPLVFDNANVVYLNSIGVVGKQKFPALGSTAVLPDITLAGRRFVTLQSNTAPTAGDLKLTLTYSVLS